MAHGTKPFTIGPHLARLTGAYPRAPDVLQAASEGPREKAILARLWISEGIPFAFKNCPGLYEELRNSLARRLELDAKQISVAGSGRLGYSLAPDRWGEPYEEVASDLDLFTVSEGLFRRLCEETSNGGVTTTFVAKSSLGTGQSDATGKPTRRRPQATSEGGLSLRGAYRIWRVMARSWQ